jgi:hypothetical protein
MRFLPSTALLFLAVGTVLGLVEAVLYHIMIAEVNRATTGGKRISHLFDYPGAFFKVVKQHRQLYPYSRLRNWMYVFATLVVICFFGMMWGIGFFRLPSG